MCEGDVHRVPLLSSVALPAWLAGCGPTFPDYQCVTSIVGGNESGGPIASSGKIAYVGGFGSIAIYDLSEPKSPKTLTPVPFPTSVQAIVVNGNRLLVAGGTVLVLYDAAHSLRMLPGGDVLAGDVNGGYIGELDLYRRNANAWTAINQSAGDGQWLIAYTPFALDSGATLAFRLFSLAGHAYLSVADFVPSAQDPAAPYQARFTEEHAQYAPTGSSGPRPTYSSATSVGAFQTGGQQVTVVLVTKDGTTGAFTISAYIWAEGEAGFTELYSAVPISSALGGLMVNARDQVGCHLDGTVYARVTENHATSLALADGAGERRLGVVTDNSGGAYSPTLAALRFSGGAYYAVAGLLLGTGATRASPSTW